MTDRALVASDYTAYSPVFTDGNEAASACDELPTVTVTSRVTGEVYGTYTGDAVGDQIGVYVASLSAAGPCAELDIVDLVWTGVAGGRGQTLTQEIEVVGGFYESIPALRTITVLSGKPAATLRKYRTEIEDICETHRGTAYVPRVAIETFDADQRGQIRLKHRHVQRVLAVTVDGTARDIDLYEVDQVTRTFSSDAGGMWFAETMTVAYVHGYTSPPQALVEACREYVRAKVTVDSSNADRNPTSVTDLATQQVYRFGTADPKYGRYTGIESVDSRINQVDDERTLIR